MNILFSGFVAFCLLVAACSGQQVGRCEAWEGEPAVCAPYLRLHADPRHAFPLVFVPDTLKDGQKDMVAVAIAALPSVLSAAPASCRKAATQLACLSVFPLCASELALPRPVCAAACENTNFHCGKLGDFPLVECSATDDAGNPLWPPAASTVLLPNTTTPVTVPCVGSGRVPENARPTNCPRRFAFSKEAQTCMPVCPDAYLTFSDAESFALLTIRRVLCPFAEVLFILALIPWLMMKEKRQFPNYSVPMWGLCFSVFNVGNAMTIVQVGSSAVCADKFTITDSEYPPCHLQAVLLLLGTLCGLGWMTNTFMNCALSVHYNALIRSRALELFQHGLAWGPGMIFIVVLEIFDLIGVNIPDLNMCLAQQDTLICAMLFFNLIASVYSILSFAFIIFSLAHIYHVKFSLQKSPSHLMQAAKRILKETGVVLTFSTICFLWLLYLQAILWYTWWHAPMYIEDLEGRARCYAAGEPHCDAGTLLPFPLLTGLMVGTVVPCLCIAFITFREWGLREYRRLLAT
eukprot:CAMPEP_0177634812 /NCGR_PEP_ID=MMETSP0447-20121125/3564_1 /TAXON_ID=0 /ORGANISM="Stygamoeba regulata, Strain BSH-02190019" /LENGTH=518 /DNA_ID=CAMNT_0019136551 /DNA_START=105 /DNA_END=1657 /DNA_ORIENTATION=-